MDNPEKLATYGTQDEEKQNKNTTHYVLDTTIRKLKHIKINKTWALLQTTGGKTNRTSLPRVNKTDTNLVS